jgi:hypothetical protein
LNKITLVNDVVIRTSGDTVPEQVIDVGLAIQSVKTVNDLIEKYEEFGKTGKQEILDNPGSTIRVSGWDKFKNFLGLDSDLSKLPSQRVRDYLYDNEEEQNDKLETNETSSFKNDDMSCETQNICCEPDDTSYELENLFSNSTDCNEVLNINFDTDTLL